jgi:hypothetical protein
VSDLYIVDSEFKNTGGKLASHRNFLSEIIEDYIKIADFLIGNQNGKYIKTLKVFVDSMREIPADIVETGEYFQSDCDNFILEINQADEYLYE